MAFLDGFYMDLPPSVLFPCGRWRFVALEIYIYIYIDAAFSDFTLAVDKVPGGDRHLGEEI